MDNAGSTIDDRLSDLEKSVSALIEAGANAISPNAGAVADIIVPDAMALLAREIHALVAHIGLPTSAELSALLAKL